MFRSNIIRSVAGRRARAFERMRRDAVALQQSTLRQLLAEGEQTSFGRDHGVRRRMSGEEFARAVPVRDYDRMRPYIARMLAGERSVLWPGRASSFARSSGTTSDRSKYIPVTQASIRRAHGRGMADVAAMYAVTHPRSRLFEGKTLTLGGSCRHDECGSLVGDLSAVLIRRMAAFGGWFRLPRVRTALIENFDSKVEAICRECTRQRVTSFAGVPSWNLVLMRRVLEYTGKSNLLEVWPELELFVHGGVGFAPYRRAFEELLPSSGFAYMETYNASEGFFAMADDLQRDDMMLMTDYGTYYEFRRGSEVCPLEGVRTGERYAMIITSCNGLWRYELGDVVEFTSTDPYRIRLVGRTRQFINAFGEELMADTAERALAAACEATGAVVGEYTVAPRYMTLRERGAHEWAVEFCRRPADMGHFVSRLDAELRRMNSDYDAKRNTTLTEPVVREVASGTFVGWMRLHGKNKVPHLRNDRSVIEQIQEENFDNKLLTPYHQCILQ